MITNEEAKKIIFNQWQSFLEDNVDYGGISEAYKMAFKVLAQESITWIVGKDNCQVAVRNMPIDKMQKICAIIGDEEQQPCEDCISREETLKAFAEKCGGECGCCVYNGSGYDTAENCKLIKSMPSVTPKEG